jgi:hypothetical protein
MIFCCAVFLSITTLATTLGCTAAAIARIAEARQTAERAGDDRPNQQDI